MAPKHDVETFLQTYHQKLATWPEIKFRNDRRKNFQALLNLNISSDERMDIIKGLSVEDYVKGPEEDILNGGAPLWVFGVELKGRHIYIKLSLGRNNMPVACISFHEAEHALEYPYKN